MNRPGQGSLLPLVASVNRDPPVQVTLQWSEARLVACDGLQGFEFAETGNNAVRFKFHKSVTPFEPGERRTIGWLRLNKEAEVQIEMASQSN